MEGGKENDIITIHVYYIITSPICCFNSSTVQPFSTLTGLAGPTSPVDRSTTDTFRLIPTPSNTCTCN